MNIRKHLIPLSTLFLLSIIAHHVWFFSNAPISFGDWIIDFPERLKEYYSFPTIWISSFNIGMPNYSISFWPFQVIAGIMARLGFSTPFIMKILFMFPIALLTPLFSYLLSFYIFKSKKSAFMSALVFTYSTLIVVLRGSFLTFHMAVTFIPLFLLFYMIFLNKNTLLSFIGSTVTLLIISLYEFRVYYIVLWIIFFYTIYYILVFSRRTLKNLLIISFNASLVVTLSILFNAYVLLGLFSMKALTSAEAFNNVLFGSWYVQLIKVFTLFQFDWTGGKIDGWVQQDIPIWFFIIPVCAFLGYLLSKNKKETSFFALLSLLGIMFAKLNRPPFIDLYQWVFDNIPGFVAFRESGKFNFVVVLSYAILLGSLIKSLEKNKGKKIITNISFIILASIFLWNAKPLITGEFGTLFTPRTIPNDYYIIHEYISNQNNYFRTLWTPRSSRWGTWRNLNPVIDNFQANTSFLKPILKKNANVYKIHFTDNILDVYSVKYVIVPLRDVKNDDDFFRITGSREYYVKYLNKVAYLESIDINLTEVLIFENPNFKPHLYMTNQPETIKKSIDYNPIKDTMIRPTEYAFQTDNVREPFYINFSESYHPQWRLRVGDFHWFDSIIHKDYALSNTNHIKNDAQLNSFYIDPDKICKTFICEKNIDGTYNIEFRLYFEPQGYVYVGLIVSGATVIFLFSAILYYAFKTFRKASS